MPPPCSPSSADAGQTEVSSCASLSVVNGCGDSETQGFGSTGREGASGVGTCAQLTSQVVTTGRNSVSTRIVSGMATLRSKVETWSCFRLQLVTWLYCTESWLEKWGKPTRGRASVPEITLPREPLECLRSVGVLSVFALCSCLCTWREDYCCLSD